MSAAPPAGGKLNHEAAFHPVRIAVLTVSDTRDEESDTSGALLAEMIERDGHLVVARDLVKDEIPALRARLITWRDDPSIEVVISTGGTGLTGRDVTPEAMRGIFEKEIDGFNAIWHSISFQSVGLSTLQSRACAGVSNGTFFFALPGSNGACRDGWEKIIRWELDSRHRPCNMVELLPRLQER